MTVQEFAAFVAALKHFGPPHRAEVLARMGVADARFAEEELRWTQAIVDTSSNEDNSLVEAFGLAFSAEQSRLRRDKPPLSALGVLPEPARDAEATEAPSPPPAPPFAGVAAEGPRPTPLLTPTYLRPEASPEPHRPVGLESSVDETVMGGIPTAKPLPFEGRLEAPPPALPTSPASDAGGTVMAPLPGEVRAMIAQPEAFDPDATQKPFRNPLPIIPFRERSSADRSSERELETRTTPRPTEHLERGTVALAEDDAPTGAPLPFEEIQPDAVDLSMFPIERYAEITVILSRSDDRAKVLRRFVLTEGMWRAVAQAWAARINQDPKLRAEFHAAVERARRGSRGGQPGT